MLDLMIYFNGLRTPTELIVLYTNNDVFQESVLQIYVCSTDNLYKIAVMKTFWSFTDEMVKKLFFGPPGAR